MLYQINSFTGPWSGVESITEVYPTYTIKSDGVTILNDANANSTTSLAVGDTATLAFTGASYYGPQTTFTVERATQTLPDIQASAIVATTDLVWTAYDYTGNTALTADDNSTNTADFAGGATGANEVVNYYFDLKNNVADKNMRIGAFLVWYCGGEIDDFTLENSKLTETTIPSGDLTDSFDLTDDTGATTACSVKHIYVPTSGDYIELSEWDRLSNAEHLGEKLLGVLDTDDSTGPTANGDSYFGIAVADYACETDTLGEIFCGWHDRNSNNDVDDIGLNEAFIASGFNGLDVGVAVEPQ